LPQIKKSNIRVAAQSWGELYYGIYKMPLGKRRNYFENWLDELIAAYRDETCFFDTESAQIWGRLLAQQRALGSERPAIDLQIAATALRHGLPIVTRNTKHFEGLGLTLINPWAKTV
jgi:predicted nucleic acid-binding protein